VAGGGDRRFEARVFGRAAASGAEVGSGVGSGFTTTDPWDYSAPAKDGHVPSLLLRDLG
jgi:hypothetical protein